MDRPVHEWVEEHAARLHGQFLLDSTDGEVMRVTTQRLDAWMVKGLDGITNMILDRSAMDIPIQGENIIALKQDIERLERVINNKQETIGETTDSVIFEGLRNLSFLIHRRIFEQSLGGLAENEREKLKEYLHRMKMAVVRFQDRRN